MKLILFICFTHLHNTMKYIYTYLTYSTCNGCIQPVWLYLNTLKEYKHKYKVSAATHCDNDQESNCNRSKVSLLLLVANKTTTQVGNGTDMTVIST